MVNYGKYNTTNDHAFNVCNAIIQCKKSGENGIVFDKSEYHFYPDKASESMMCVSNNDIYGFRRVAFLLSDMDNFCIDGSGSTFIFHGEIVPFFVNGSKNITVKNVTMDYEKSCVLDLEVTQVNDKSFEAIVCDGEYCVENGILKIERGLQEKDSLYFIMIRTIGDSNNYVKGTDEEFIVKNPSIFVEDLSDGKLRISNCSLNVKEGMHLLAKGRDRHVCNIVVNKSTDITLEDITMYSSYSMGVLCQMSRNITIDKMSVTAHKGRLFSLAADATHFVNCTGLVKVSNSSFSDQLDDALNVHGIFTRITDVAQDYITVKYMHKSAKGIDIFGAGDKISVLNPKTLVGNRCYTIKNAEVINLNDTKLYLNEPTCDINVGEVVESITNNCDVIFENNRVFRNRARGILVATKGRVDIRNNYFNSSGSAINFESDGENGFESGGTTDVRIYGNTFENCCIGPIHWGSHVIQFVPRRESVDGMYYHGFISITDNNFISNAAPILYADNIEELVFKNNTSDKELEYTAKRCGKIQL